jgi:hypothetical protein
MQKRLSLADLKAKATTNVVKNTEVYMGGNTDGCHPRPIIVKDYSAPQDVLKKHK